MYCVSVFFALLSCVIVSSEIQRPSTSSTPLKFSISSRRNITGHWIVQVQLEHGVKQENRETGPWEVEIDHSTLKYEEAESVLIVATVSVPPKRPGLDYELVPGMGYYKFHPKGKTWHEARNICFQEETHLVIPNSEIEVSFLQSIWNKYPKDQLKQYKPYLFVGFHDQFKEGDYITIFGQHLTATGYSKWFTGEPSNSTAENCGSLTTTSGYNDISCTSILPFFCEQEL